MPLPFVDKRVSRVCQCVTLGPYGGQCMDLGDTTVNRQAVVVLIVM